MQNYHLVGGHQPEVSEIARYGGTCRESTGAQAKSYNTYDLKKIRTSVLEGIITYEILDLRTSWHPCQWHRPHSVFCLCGFGKSL